MVRMVLPFSNVIYSKLHRHCLHLNIIYEVPVVLVISFSFMIYCMSLKTIPFFTVPCNRLIKWFGKLENPVCIENDQHCHWYLPEFESTKGQNILNWIQNVKLSVCALGYKLQLSLSSKHGITISIIYGLENLEWYSQSTSFSYDLHVKH